MLSPVKGWSRNQTLPESADDQPADQLHHLVGHDRSAPGVLRHGRYCQEVAEGMVIARMHMIVGCPLGILATVHESQSIQWGDGA